MDREVTLNQGWHAEKNPAQGQGKSPEIELCVACSSPGRRLEAACLDLS
jgi:hypothetical protein